jgi:hypothetical protein
VRYQEYPRDYELLGRVKAHVEKLEVKKKSLALKNREEAVEALQ